MKLVKKFVVAVLLVSALSVSAYAGDLETPGYAPPPPPSYTASCTDETTETSNGDVTDSTELSDTLYDALQAVLVLF